MNTAAPLIALFREAAFGAVETRAIDVPTVLRDFDDCWTPFLGGAGARDAECRSMPTAGPLCSEEVPRRRPIGDDGSIAPVARARAVPGVVA